MNAESTPAQMLMRGLRRRCPLCDSNHLFRRWLAMVERCPGCHYRFEREEGFFLGAYVVNLAVTEGLLLLLSVIPLIVLLDRNPDSGIAGVVIGGILAAVIAPLIFYPISKTLWTAIDLIMRPVAQREPADRS